MLGPNATLESAAASIVSLVDSLVPLLIGIALLIFFWGIIKYVWAAGDSHSKANGREVIVWGLLALFIIISIWGILSMACWSFLGDSKCTPVSQSVIDRTGGAGGNLRPIN